MDRLDNLISEIPIIFNKGWYDNSKALFYNHPSNEKRQDTVEFSQLDEEENWNPIQVKLFDFLYGVRDEDFDNYFDHLNDDKLEFVNEWKYEVRAGEVYETSNKFYPAITYGKYKRSILNVLEKSTNSVTSFGDKTKILTYTNNLLNDAIKPANSNPAPTNKIFIINLLEEIEKTYTFLQEVQEVLATNQDFISFNLKGAELVRLYYLLNSIGMVSSNRKQLLAFASKYFKVKDTNGKTKLPKCESLNQELKEFIKKCRKEKTWVEDREFTL